MTRQNSSSETVVTGPSCGVEPPALLCSTVSLPKRFTVSFIAASTLFCSRTSQWMNSASPPEVLPLARADSSAALPRASSMSAMTTLAPSSANRSAVARPMPPPPPVMNVTFSANRAMSSLPSIALFLDAVSSWKQGGRFLNSNNFIDCSVETKANKHNADESNRDDDDEYYQSSP